MKKNIITTLFLATSITLCQPWAGYAQTVEDADVSLSNLGSNSYFGGYDDNTKMVSDLNFMVLADGTNSNFVTPAFTVKVYIWDGSNPNFVKTYNDEGLYHFGSKTYANESVDLSGLSLPAGTYRLGVYVDADDEIPNPPDDPADNAYLLGGDIVFTPGTSTGVYENKEITWDIYPNPATDEVRISWDGNNSDATRSLAISNLQGQVIRYKVLNPGTSSYTVNMRDLTAGVYLFTLQTDNGISVRKIVKQ